MERAPTHKDVRDAPCFQRTDVGPSDVRAKIAKAAEENCDMAWPNRNGVALLFDRPATVLTSQSMKAPTQSGKDSLIRQSTILP